MPAQPNTLAAPPQARPQRGGARLGGDWLVWLVALACALAITGIGLSTLQRIRAEHRQAVAAALQANSNLAIAFEQQVFRTLKAAEQVAAFVRAQYLREGAALDMQQWARHDVLRETMFNIVSVVDANGVIVASSLPLGTVNYADRAFFQAQRDASVDALFVNPPVLGRVSGRWQLPMSMRITLPDGSFAGVVVLSVDPVSFTDFYRLADTGAQGLLELTGADGAVRGRKLGGAVQFGQDAKGLPWFQRWAEAPEGGLLDEGRALDGVARIVSYRAMAGYPLMVTVGTAYDQVLAPALQRRNLYLLIAMVASLVLVGLCAGLVAVLARQRAVANALRASEALYSATFHQAAMGIAHIAPDGRILRVNEKFCRMLGHDADALCQRTMHELCDGQRCDQLQALLMRPDASPGVDHLPEAEVIYRRKDGTQLWVSEALSVVRDAQGHPKFLVIVVQDVTARKELENRLSYGAQHDALTGLPNRVKFYDRLSQVLDSARRHGRGVAVLFLDLDGFKEVNDSLGHAAGDALLQQVAQRLQDCVRAEDTVARFGGDEFGIVLATVAQVSDCETVARKVLQALATPFELQGARVSISTSVGAALFPQHGDVAETLLAKADQAMYAAKSQGKNRFNWWRIVRFDDGDGEGEGALRVPFAG